MLPFPHEPNGCHIEILGAPNSDLQAAIIRDVDRDGHVIGNLRPDQLQANASAGLYDVIYAMPDGIRVFRKKALDATGHPAKRSHG